MGKKRDSYVQYAIKIAKENPEIFSACCDAKKVEIYYEQTIFFKELSMMFQEMATLLNDQFLINGNKAFNEAMYVKRQLFTASMINSALKEKLKYFVGHAPARKKHKKVAKNIVQMN
ncbi:MAG: hypothetical protein A2275_19150 [Bacteroidetes bacterium RIFOXYA12_FULL_35_11]|nr:MAG: hypothetical protein A2275_19150 [Bacteroidetes bacterium RIFOXYA12_FULL_35_11]